jgi:Leucine-rich repeat (LRR) protein
VKCEAGTEFGQASVTEISLMENNLNGVIPSILFHLPDLRKLDVRNNAVSIGLNAIFQAEGLEELYLDKTLVSTLDGIGRASSLRVLHLNKASFGWLPIPDELFDLISLEDLNLSEAMFGGTLSSKVGQLTKLKRLNLVGNSLSGQIPDEIGNLGFVQDLDLSDNNWYGTLPTSISGLTSLARFGLNNIQATYVGVTGQLRSFSTMPNLRNLYLSNNQFTGSIPDNFLGGITDTSTQISVYLDGNELGGEVPSSLVALQRLNIYLENNMLTGFGTGICEQSRWMDGKVGRYGCDAILCPAGEFSPSGRQVSEDTACIPCPDLQRSPVLGSNFCLSLQKQKEKDVLVSLFQGTNGMNWNNKDGWTDDNVDICKWYGIKCKEGSTVESILLGSNGLIGTVPSGIYTMPNLKFLWLYSNHVDLSFDGIDQATSLTSLLLDSTRVRTLDGIGSGQSLIDVDVRFNNLKGTLPAELSQLANLESFTCSENDFTGTVPEFKKLRNLRTLRMGNNDFSGTVPSFAENPALLTVDLSDNRLEGPVPENMFSAVPASGEIYLDLSNNHLTGTVPGDLSRFAQMTILLRDNRISGINPNLCEETLWNEGDVQNFKCDAILCRKGTVSPIGRASVDIECRPCSKNKFLGGTSCGSSAPASRLVGSLIVLLGTAVAITGLLLL